ncbi:MAG: thiamine pyrophosphate-dependent enzyme [Methanomicrobiales archaeon]|nr:thiamine pyrophosphate-dependent enzyme [Methanomicrobiales archaeon]MDD1658414.1 thiamine pyrophosphate-dependent enzyme [Methanomicrobiales archaeon]
MAEIPKEEFLLRTTSACAGCSSSLCLRYILKASGADTVLVIPACCTSVIQGMYPKTAMNVPVYNIAFAAAAACASGMSAAFRALGKRTNVIVYAGDGGTVDIGLQALSGAFERETDFLYLCYDNEAYGNTGMQRSGATPVGARTTTTPGGKAHPRKDIEQIVEAHRPPYLATACSAYPTDLFQKVKKALAIPGAKFIHILAPCPTGWKFPPGKTIEMGKLAVKTGMWILYEREYGRTTISAPSKAAMAKPLPLLDYLSVQGRFKGITPEQVQELEREIASRRERLLREAG